MGIWDNLLRLKEAIKLEKVVIKGTPPFVEFTLTPDQASALFGNKPLVEKILSYGFLRRRVFWESYSAEDPEYSLQSLREAAEELDGLADELLKERSTASMALHKFVLTWSNGCVKYYKELRDKIIAIENDKNSGLTDESHYEKRVAMKENLFKLRAAIYPAVLALSEVLDEGSEVREQVRHYLKIGAIVDMEKGLIVQNATPTIDILL